MVRLRGLPYSAGEADVAAFLAGLPVAAVHLLAAPSGRPAGEAMVELPTEADAAAAVARHRAPMGPRRAVEGGWWRKGRGEGGAW